MVFFVYILRLRKNNDKNNFINNIETFAVGELKFKQF